MRDSRRLHPSLALGPRAILATALGAAFLAAASPAAAAPVINTTTDQSLGDCSATCSLRDAVALSSPGDTLAVPAGHYVLTLGPIDIPFSMTLAGAGARTTVIDANGGPGIFTITVTITTERARAEEVAKDRFFRFERRYGTFSRAIGLPQGVSEHDIRADYKDGVLELYVVKPKAPEPLFTRSARILPGPGNRLVKGGKNLPMA